VATVGVDFDLSFLDITTTVKVNAAASAKTIDVTTSTGMAAGDAVAITLNDTNVHWDIIASVTDGDTIVITTGIPSAADAGNAVKSYNAYMCRSEGDRKMFSVTDSPLLPPTLITGTASTDNIQPERGIITTMKDWRKGFQQYLLEDAYKYYDSENCDARLKEKVTLPPKRLTTISFGNPVPTQDIPDAGFEEWDDANTPTIWTVMAGDGVLRGSAPGGHEGDYYARNPTDQGNDITGGMYVDMDTFYEGYKGTEFTFKVWVYTSTSNWSGSYWAKITIDDGVGTTVTTKDSGSGEDYTQISVTRTLDADATRLRLQVEYGVDVVDLGYNVRWDDCSLTYQAKDFGAIPQKGIVEFGDDIVVASGQSLFNIASGSAVWLENFPQTITDLCVFEDNLYIAQGWGNDYYYTSDLITFTAFTDAAIHPKYFANIGGATMICADTNSTVKSSANPIMSGTAWSTLYQVGSDDFDITGLPNSSSTWFARKEDDLYYLSGSDVWSLLDLKTEASTTYTYPVYTWGGNLYIPSGVNSLYEYNIGTGVATVISPTRYAIGDADYDEDIIAMAGDETYLYCAIDNGSDIKILAGRWENVAGDTDWYWHPLYTLADHNDITSMAVSALSGSKRLYVGTDTYTDGVQPYFLPVSYTEPYTETGYECEASGTFYTPWLDGGFPTEEKYWDDVDITTICCTDKTSAQLSYRVKGGEWVALTTCTTSAYDGGYPDETTDNRTIGVSSERIQFKLAMAAAVDEYTPILLGQGGGISVRGRLQSDRTRQINAQLLIADRINERTRTTLARTVSTDLTNLRAYYAANDKETIVAPDDTEYNVTFDRESYREDAAYDETGHKNVWWVSVKLLEV